jgi:DNA-binding response OmpR family regulator
MDTNIAVETPDLSSGTARTPAPLSCPACATPAPVLFYDRDRAAIVGDRLLLFSPQEFALLKALCSSAAIQSPDELAVRLYGKLPTDPRSIRVLVCRLRRRLAERGVLGFVQSVRAQGYVVALASIAATQL